MIVISLVNPPRALHGDLSKWLQEINTNVYVGNVNARVREKLWDRITDSIKTGQATMVFTTNNEQGYDFKVWGTTWQPVDFDGLILMKKPFPKQREGIDLELKYQSKYSTFKKAKSTRNLNPITEEEEQFAVIDIETTGLDYKNDQIIEIGIVIGTLNKIVKQESFLINCPVSLGLEIVNLTGITDELLKTKGISLERALESTLSLVTGKKIIFHNAPFDLKFLRNAFKKVGISPPAWKIEDTYQISKQRIRGLLDYRLETICKELQCNYLPSHRALQDCKSTWEVYIKLMNS